MGAWLETYRGAVTPSDCDVMEHFTIGAYFDRYSDANLALMEAGGIGRGYHEEAGRGCVAVECHARFMAELRAGDLLHIESGFTGAGGKLVSMGHKVMDSVSGERCATLVQKLIHFDLASRKALPLAPEQRERLDALAVDWDGPPSERREELASDQGFLASGRDTIKPWEIDIMGHLNFSFYVHRFSAAAQQLTAAFGMTPDYMRARRRGISTFELNIRFRRELGAGDLIAVRSGLAEIGNSSFRMVHRMSNVRGGELSAVMSQYAVHLDLDARRPAPFPAELKERALALIPRRP